MLKVNAAGDSIWSRTFGGRLNDDAHFVLPTSDQGFALAGYTNSFAEGTTDFWLVKTAPDTAAIQWYKQEHAKANTEESD